MDIKIIIKFISEVMNKLIEHAVLSFILETLLKLI